MTNTPRSYAFMEAGYDESGFDSWMLTLPLQWRKYTSSKEIPYRVGLEKFQKLYTGYQRHKEKIQRAIEGNSDIDCTHYACEIDDAIFDNFILNTTSVQDINTPQGITSNELQRRLFHCMNKCFDEKNKLVELSEKLADLNGKPTTITLRKWLYLNSEIRKQIKKHPVEALPYFIDSHYDLATENQRILKENVTLKEEHKAHESLEDAFHKLQEKNLEIQERRANECNELLCVKGQLDKLKQEASRLWKEKEYYLSQLRGSAISVLKNQLAVEKAKVLDLTNKNQNLSKEKEKLLTRLSEVAGAKLTSNNPAITDLSDENRPIKLAEKFSQLYDDEWTDSLEEITNTGIDEKTSISFLLRIVMNAFQLCSRSQSMLLNLKDCQTVMWCESVELRILHEIQLPDAAKFQVQKAIKRYSHSAQKDLISTAQKRFQKKLNDMLLDHIKKGKNSQVPSVNHQSKQRKSNENEVQGEQKDRYNYEMDSELPTKPKILRYLSAGDIVVGCGYTKSTDVQEEKEIVPRCRKKSKNRLSESARGDFLMPSYEDYVKEGFLIDKKSIGKLFSEPITLTEQFTKTTQFADHCVELCWLMQSTQPPIYVSANIPENKELKHEIFKAYTKSGQIIDYIVWPAMYLHEQGPLLSKGVAQPK